MGKDTEGEGKWKHEFVATQRRENDVSPTLGMDFLLMPVNFAIHNLSWCHVPRSHGEAQILSASVGEVDIFWGKKGSCPSRSLETENSFFRLRIRRLKVLVSPTQVSSTKGWDVQILG